MAKYTTQVRNILSAYNGYDEEVGYEDIEDNINGAWDKVFDLSSYEDFTYVFERQTLPPVLVTYNYGETICKNILREYYTREIGAETVGLWKLWMNNKLIENAEYIKQLYKGKLDIFAKVHSEELSKYYVKTIEGTASNDNSEGKSGTDASNHLTVTDNRYVKDYDDSGTFSTSNKNLDTPQGNDFALLDGVEVSQVEKLYGTNGQFGTGGGSNTSDEVRKTDFRTIDNVNKSFSHAFGEDGEGEFSSEERVYDLNGKLPQEIVDEIAESFYDINMEIIEMFRDLFMNIY